MSLVYNFSSCIGYFFIMIIFMVIAIVVTKKKTAWTCYTVGAVIQLISLLGKQNLAKMYGTDISLYWSIYFLVLLLTAIIVFLRKNKDNKKDFESNGNIQGNNIKNKIFLYKCMIVLFSAIAIITLIVILNKNYSALKTDVGFKSSDIDVGNTVNMGTYNNASIEWNVLDKRSDKVLLISKYCLLDQVYHTDVKHDEGSNEWLYGKVTWEVCALREWLNGNFLNDAFTDAEKKQIIETTLENPDNSDYGVEGGNDTKDMVFLLSMDEAEKYFSSDEERKATHTNGSSACWWLRSPGAYDYYTAGIGINGSIGNYGEFFDEEYGVRPAIWVNIDGEN